MAQRQSLHDILVALLGSSNVYFQPPANIVMNYPCIVYKRDDIRVDHANNLPYNRHKRYQVTVIDRNPDSDISDKVGALPLCTFDRFYAADNLNHDVYQLFF